MPPRPSENLRDISSLSSPYLPLSNRTNHILKDQFGLLSWDEQRREKANRFDAYSIEDEIGGFNQQRIYPGLSTDPRDVALKGSMFPTC